MEEEGEMEEEEDKKSTGMTSRSEALSASSHCGSDPDERGSRGG